MVDHVTDRDVADPRAVGLRQPLTERIVEAELAPLDRDQERECHQRLAGAVPGEEVIPAQGRAEVVDAERDVAELAVLVEHRDLAPDRPAGEEGIGDLADVDHHGSHVRPPSPT